MNAFVKYIEYYLPDKIVTNQDLVKDFPEWSIDKVASKVGVNERHLAGENETAGDMAEKAARLLFERNHVSPSIIDFVLLCTQSPDYFLPSTACLLQERLSIPTTAGALDFNLGCSGAVYGLALAKGLVSSRLARNVLLLTSETYNKYIHPLDKGNRSIFGDGAAACLISTDGMAEIGEFVLGTDGRGINNLIVRTGAARQSRPNRKEDIDVEGHVLRDDFLYMNGGEIFNFTLETVPPMLDELLSKNNLDQSSVDYFVFHQANKFMLNTLRKVCAIPQDRFYNNLTKTGNTVSSTIPIALKDCLDADIIKPGMKVAIAGFGVGLSWGGAILRF